MPIISQPVSLAPHPPHRAVGKVRDTLLVTVIGKQWSHCTNAGYQQQGPTSTCTLTTTKSYLQKRRAWVPGNDKLLMDTALASPCKLKGTASRQTRRWQWHTSFLLFALLSSSCFFKKSLQMWFYILLCLALKVDCIPTGRHEMSFEPNSKKKPALKNPQSAPLSGTLTLYKACVHLNPQTPSPGPGPTSCPNVNSWNE